MKWLTSIVVIISNTYLLIGVFHNGWQLQTAMVWYAFEILVLSLFQFLKSIQKNWGYDSLGGIWIIAAAMVLSFFIVAFYSPRIQHGWRSFEVNMDGLGLIVNNLIPGIIAYTIYVSIIFILSLFMQNFNVNETPLDPDYYLKKMKGGFLLVLLGIFIPFQRITLILIVAFQILYSLPLWKKTAEIATE